jgi:hypothetical protein
MVVRVYFQDLNRVVKIEQSQHIEQIFRTALEHQSPQSSRQFQFKHVEPAKGNIVEMIHLRQIDEYCFVGRRNDFARDLLNFLWFDLFVEFQQSLRQRFFSDHLFLLQILASDTLQVHFRLPVILLNRQYSDFGFRKT